MFSRVTKLLSFFSFLFLIIIVPSSAASDGNVINARQAEPHTTELSYGQFTRLTPRKKFDFAKNCQSDSIAKWFMRQKNIGPILRSNLANVLRNAFKLIGSHVATKAKPVSLFMSETGVVNKYELQLNPDMLNYTIHGGDCPEKISGPGRYTFDPAILGGNTHRADGARIGRRWQRFRTQAVSYAEAMINLWGRQTLRDDMDVEKFQYAGNRVDIYLLDTGVRVGHDWLRKAKAKHWTGMDNSPTNAEDMGTVNDENGHGTAVAGIISRIAPMSQIVSIKVVFRSTNEFGTRNKLSVTRNLVTKMMKEIIYEHGKKKETKEPNWHGSIIQLSVFDDVFDLDLAKTIEAAWKSGIPVIVPAGNEGKPVNEARWKWPCSYKGVICVGSVNQTYDVSNFSNHGLEVMIYAPGENIVTASHEGPSSNLDSYYGTSMAAAHVSGILARFISFESLRNSEKDVNLAITRLLDNSQEHVLRNLPAGSRNILANTGIDHPEKDNGALYKGAPRAPPEYHYDMRKTLQYIIHPAYIDQGPVEDTTERQKLDKEAKPKLGELLSSTMEARK